MAEYTGSALYLQWVYSGASGTVTLNTNYRTCEVDEPTDVVDSSAGADTHRSGLATLTTGTIKLEFLDQTGGTANWNALAPKIDGTLTIGPEGTASGKPKQALYALIVGRNRVFKYDDVVTISVDMRMQAASSDNSF